MSEDPAAEGVSQDGVQQRLADVLSGMGYSVDRSIGRIASGLEMTIEDGSGRTALVTVRDVLTPEFVQETTRRYSGTYEIAPLLIVATAEVASSTMQGLTGTGKIWVVHWRDESDPRALATEVQSALETVPFYADGDRRLQALLEQSRVRPRE